VVEGKREAIIILHDGRRYIYIMHSAHRPCVRADLKSNHLVTKHCPLLPWISGVAAGVLVGPD